LEEILVLIVALTAKAGFKGVNRQNCRRQPPTIYRFLRLGGYAHTLKGYFYTNLGGTLTGFLPTAGA
jgi:hypothetical protein